jgi:hypothetical protein
MRKLKLAVLMTIDAMGGFEFAASRRWCQRRLLILCDRGVPLEDERQWRPRMPFYRTIR